MLAQTTEGEQEAGSQPGVPARGYIASLLRRASKNRRRPSRLASLLGCGVLFAFLGAGTRAGQYFGAIHAASVPPVRAPGSEAPVPRAFYGRRLEPPGSVVLHGGGPVDEASFARYAAALAPNAPMLTATFVDLHDDLPAFFAQLRRGLQREEREGERGWLIPQIGVSMNAGGADRHYEQQVASGEEDQRLSELIAGLRSLNRPVFLRLGAGFNGSATGYEPGPFVAAFRRVARHVRGAGLEQVALVWDWSPEAELELEERGARERDAAERWTAFYPGDEVVDWWGLNLYSEPEMSSPATAAFLAAADSRGFPVSIGESAPRGHDASEGSLVLDAWFRPYFNLIAGTRSIKAFCYLDRDWRAYPQWSTWGNGRIESDPVVLAYVRNQLSQPLYAGLRERHATDALLGIKQPGAEGVPLRGTASIRR